MKPSKKDKPVEWDITAKDQFMTDYEQGKIDPNTAIVVLRKVKQEDNQINTDFIAHYSDSK